jgi:serine protease Do
LKAGDIILQMEGLVLGTDGTKADYCQILRSHKPTDTLTINVLRWQSQELLEGQINGRQLAVTGTFSSASASATATTGPASGNTGGTTTVTDNSNAISMDIPSDWKYDGSAWQNTWNIGGKSADFTAATLTASPDPASFASSWGTTGIFIAASRDWANIGGYANLLEGVASAFADCTPKGNQNYKDAIYEGELVVYTNCGTQRSTAAAMAVRPIKNPTAYLVLIELKYITQAELDELDKILTSANVNP